MLLILILTLRNFSCNRVEFLFIILAVVLGSVPCSAPWRDASSKPWRAPVQTRRRPLPSSRRALQGLFCFSPNVLQANPDVQTSGTDECPRHVAVTWPEPTELLGNALLGEPPSAGAPSELLQDVPCL